MTFRRLSLTLYHDVQTFEGLSFQEPGKPPWRASIMRSNILQRSMSVSAINTKEVWKLSAGMKQFGENETNKAKESRPVSLAHLTFEDKTPNNNKLSKSPVLVHHNLIGNKENWKTACKEIFHVTRRTVSAIDARNHGDSPHIDSMSYSEMAKDVESFVNKMAADKICYVGHNVGGKVGLLLAMQNPSVFDKLIIVDSSPFVNKRSLEKWDLYCQASEKLKGIEDQLKSSTGLARKSLADKAVEKILPSKCDRAVFVSNLLTTNDQDRIWKINLDAFLQNPGFASDFPDLFFAGNVSQCERPVLFIAGENSRNICREDESLIRAIFPNSYFIWLPKTGEWLHIEQHKELMKTVVSFLEMKQN